jgi:hypothetical protein
VLSAYRRFTHDDFAWAVLAEIDRDEVANSITHTRLTIPLLGLVFYELSLLTLWIIGPMGIELGDFQRLDPGEPPHA